MICNELYNGQGLGNQLWNYAVARVQAERLGCEFSILGRERFKGKQFMELDFGAAVTGGSSPEGGPPTALPNGILHYYRERRENLRGTSMDISRTDPGLIAIGRQTKFDGNCQSTRYLESYRHKIRQWIKINNPDKVEIDERTCLIHLRCGDFSGLKDVFLPFSYYQQAMQYIKTINPEVRFACVTDQPDTAKKILPDVRIIGSSLLEQDDSARAAHHLGGPISVDFNLLFRAKYLIIPNSSFSWWAAYLSTTAQTVVAPKYWAAHNTSDGYWSTADIITDGFMYLDRTGRATTSDTCWEEKKSYEQTHDIFVSADAVQTKSVHSTLISRLRALWKD